jgi:hypothetical protein
MRKTRRRKKRRKRRRRRRRRNMKLSVLIIREAFNRENK